MSQEENTKQTDRLNRREVLKGLATIPVLGFFFIKLWQKLRLDKIKKSNLLVALINASVIRNVPAIWT